MIGRMLRRTIPDFAAAIRTRHLPLGATLVIGCAWLLLTAWMRPLALPDEGRYVGVAWEMARSGEWLTPTLDGLPYFHKPPLFYWITAFSIRVFGSHEWNVRIAPWLGASLALVATGMFTARWWSDAAARSVVLVLATMPLFYAAGQFANLDMLVAGCIAITILASAHACMSPAADSRSNVVLAAYAFAGLGVLAKGLIGVVIPALVLTFWLVAIRRPSRVLTLLTWPGIALFLLITAPWFIVMQARFPGFLHYFFIVQHFDRYTHGGFNNVQPWWFYPVVVAVLGLPWTPWLLDRRWRMRGALPREMSVLALAWLVGTLLFFSLPQSKLVGYILPATVPLAILVAQRWSCVVDAAGWRGRVARSMPVLAGIACVVTVAVVASHPLKTTRTIAAAIASRPPAPVVFVEAYYFDLAFYAGLRRPVTVLDGWDDPARSSTDSWRRELHDAASFSPARGDAVLRLPGVLTQPGNCPGARAVVVGAAELAQRYALLGSANVLATEGDVSAWEVADWSASPASPQCHGR
jgi:4-amino-4-deoxy-L-arabinose transferase-like glycosyltransferase